MNWIRAACTAWVRAVPGLVGLCLLSLLAGTSPAHARTPYPKLTTERVFSATDKPLPRLALVKDAIANLDATSRQRYFVAIVQSTGSGEWATRDYCESLWDAWTTQASQAQVTFPTSRTVLIVVAIQERSISMLFSDELQRDYGLQGGVIDRQLVQPYFLPFARQGKIEEGLVNLIQKTDAFITEADQTRQAQQARTAEQAAQLRRNAEATVQAAEKLQAETRAALDEQTAHGFITTQHAATLTTAEQQVQAARAALANNSSGALISAQTAQQTLQGTLQDLRRLPAQQQTATQTIASLKNIAADTDTKLKTLRDQGWPVVKLRQQLDERFPELSAAEALARTDPAAAAKQAQQVQQQLTALQANASSLGAARTQWQQAQQLVQADLSTLEKRLQASQAAGANVTPFTQPAQALRTRAAELDTLAGQDYATATEAAKQVTTDLVALNARIEQALQTHQYQVQSLHFMTVTLPLIIGLALAGVVALVLLILYLRQRYAVAAARRDLAGYKEQIVTLSDRLDALKERHRLLPTTDKDFREPITGATLASYNQVQAALTEFRERWLEWMDVWDRAQKLIEAQHLFGASKAYQASQILTGVQAAGQMQAVEEQCAKPLDQLEQAHETVAQAEKTATSLQQQVQLALDTLAKLDLSLDAYQPELQQLAEVRAQATAIAVADPLQAQQLLAEVQADCQELLTLLEQVRVERERWQQITDTRQQLVNRVAKLRGEGYLLKEGDSTPDARLDQTAAALAAGLEQLQQGHPEPAAQRLDDASSTLDTAQQNLEAHLAAKLAAAERLQAAQQRTGQLERNLAGSEQPLAELAREFAPQTWQAARDDQAQAARLLPKLAELIDQAEAWQADDQQLYLRAAALLIEIQVQQQIATQWLAAPATQLHALQQMRLQTRAQIDGINEHYARVKVLLQQHTADRPRATQRLEAARERLQQIGQTIHAHAPDWIVLSSQLQAAGAEVGQAEQMAQEDIRLAAQAAAELNESEQVMRTAQSFYRQGFRADVSHAAMLYQRAQSHLARQEYEQAIALANQAEASARQAREQAEFAAIAEEHRLQRERAMAAARQAAAAAVMASMMSRSSRSSRSSSRSSSFGSSSSSRSSSSRGASSSSFSSSRSRGGSQSSW